MGSIKLTVAQERVLAKAAHSARGVLRAGSLGAPERDPHRQPGYDRASIIDRMVAKKLLAPGTGAGRFVPTELGWALLGRRRAIRRARSNAETED